MAELDRRCRCSATRSTLARAIAAGGFRFAKHAATILMITTSTPTMDAIVTPSHRLQDPIQRFGARWQTVRYLLAKKQCLPMNE